MRLLLLPLPGSYGVLLGIDMTGYAVLFVVAEAGALEPPLRANKLSLHIGQSYSLVGLGDSPSVELLHALRCETSDSADVETFLLLAEAFLARQGAGRVDRHALTSFFRSMVRLFAVTPAKDLQAERRGLWGELFMMSRVQCRVFDSGPPSGTAKLSGDSTSLVAVIESRSRSRHDQSARTTSPTGRYLPLKTKR